MRRMCEHGDARRGKPRRPGVRGPCLICRSNNDKKRTNLDTFLRRKYGIDVAEYERLLKAQRGVCALCHQTCAVHSRLCVDHDHTSGRVRGLLCHKCNVILGKIADSREWATRTMEYLT